jgi:putative SOS response-associated peptidase YedK
LVRPIHDRMPVILSPADYACWLDPRLTRPEPLQALLVPAAPGTLTAYPVGRRVNRVSEDDAELIEPLTMDEAGSGQP